MIWKDVKALGKLYLDEAKVTLEKERKERKKEKEKQKRMKSQIHVISTSSAFVLMWNESQFH